MILCEYGHAIGGPAMRGDDPRRPNQEWRETERAQAVLGPIGVQVGGHRHIFPSSWVTASIQQLSLRVPRSPNSTELWYFRFVNKSRPTDVIGTEITNQVHHFGPAGFFEQEDGKHCAQASMQTRGLVSRAIPQVLKLDHGHGTVIKEHGLARIEGNMSEHAQLWTCRAWQLWMSGADWARLKSETAAPDVF